MPGHQRTPQGPQDAPAPPRAQAAAAGAARRSQLRGLDYAGGRQALQPGASPPPPPDPTAEARKEGKLEGLTFDEMWAAHPHNYQDDATQNTASDDLQRDQGWDPEQYSNTCAIRMSIMLNTIGGAYAITPARAAKAGIPRGRLAYSRTKKWYYILAAKEMWTYATTVFGAPHRVWPKNARYRDAGSFDAMFEVHVEPAIQGKRGIVAFEKIFGYRGTGHVDLFNANKLSDSGTWYASQRLMVWFV